MTITSFFCTSTVAVWHISLLKVSLAHMNKVWVPALKDSKTLLATALFPSVVFFSPFILPKKYSRDPSSTKPLPSSVNFVSPSAKPVDGVTDTHPVAILQVGLAFMLTLTLAVLCTCTPVTSLVKVTTNVCVWPDWSLVAGTITLALVSGRATVCEPVVIVQL